MTKPSELLGIPFSDESAPSDPATWFEIRGGRPGAPGEKAPVGRKPRRRVADGERSRPSDSGHGILPGAAIFSEAGGLKFGSDVHETLAKIEWLPTGLDLSPILSAFLEMPAVADLFRPPGVGAEVWRERSIACHLGGRQISAQMDRVIIMPPKGGAMGSILLVDFKTDQGDPTEIAARYHAQMRDYLAILGVWSGGRHSLRGVVATVRQPAVIEVPIE